MTNPTPHGQVPEALEDFEVRKLAAIGAVRTSSGLVERRPIEYRRELEDQFVRGFRAAEKRLSTLSAAPTITPETGNSASAKGAAITSESGTPPAEQQATKEASGGFHVWRDISTAPKDGSRFVATGHNYGLYSEVRHTCVAQWFRGCWMEASDWNETSELKYLTHWMPLPSPPDDVAAPAEQQAQPDECFPGEPKVAVPQGLIGAACCAIRNKRDGGKVLEQLRRYTVGDRSQPLTPQQAAPKAAPGELAESAAKGAIMGAAYDFRDAHISGSMNLKRSAHAILEAAVDSALAAPQPVAQQGAADGFFLLLPQRPKPEAPAGTAGLDWDAYSGAQMLAFGRDCSDAAIAALRTEQPAPSGATEEVENLRKALVYAAFALHDAPQYMLAQGIALIDGDTVRVSRDGWTVEASVNPHRQPAPATQQVGEVRRAELVPGVMHCAKCKFQLNRVTLCVSDGNAYAGNNKTEPCPNGCGPLWPVTWEQEAKNCWKALEEMHERLMAAAAPQPSPKAAPGVGNSGFDHKTAADFLNGKTISDEAVRKFVQASRWAHDEKAALSAMLLSVRGVLASREAEIALLKKALLEAEAAPQPAPDCHHRPPCDECAAIAAQRGNK